MQTSKRGVLAIIACFVLIFVSYKYYQHIRQSEVSIVVPPTPIVTHADLTSSPWVWEYTTTVGKDKVIALNQKFVLTFTKDLTNRVTSTTDCNTFSSTFIHNEEVLSFGKFSGTKMACKDSHEEDYIADLSLATSYTIKGNTLSINLNRDKGVIVFKKYTQGTTTPYVQE